MGRALRRIERRKRASRALADLVNRPDRVLVIHYSCESFYDRPDGSSPRVTSIAVRHLDSGQTYSFSIHQMAERRKCPVEGSYDELEREMLDEFHEYVRTHQGCYWLHWNMRDANYGFQAIEHRYRVLGGNPAQIPEDMRVDLSDLVEQMYGRHYISHPHMKSLVDRNHITARDFLSGAEEAQAFERGDYVKLHQSTLRKVDALSEIAQMADERSLKTDAGWRQQYGLHPQALAEWLSEHWLGTLVGFVASVLGIVGVVYEIVKIVLRIP